MEKALAIGANTDILFPVQQQQQIADGLRAGGADAQFIGLESPQGHDAFWSTSSGSARRCVRSGRALSHAPARQAERVE